MPQREFQKDQGYLTFALGEKYLRLAYVQAMSIKFTQKINNCAVIVDKVSADNNPQFLKVFDKVIVVDYTPQDWDMTQYYRAFALTPWRETVLIEADILLTHSIDHWWNAMRLRDVCLTTEVKDFRENIITSRKHRKLFDVNNLPDVYAGFMYFRYSELASEFFFVIRLIINEWNWFAKEFLIKNEDMRVRIDEVFAIAARIYGMQNVTLPISIPTFVHGKEGLWGFSEQQLWYEQLFTEWDEHVPLIGHYKQRLPLHYHHKDWITDDVIREYERNYQKFVTSSS
jgi:hypothetical protein